MTDIVPVVVPKTKEERDKVKDRYVEDINDQYAYLDFRLLIPSCMFAALSVLVLLWAISLSYYFDAERFRTNNITAWLNVTEWAERACNMTFNDIPEHWLPSVLRIFELSVQGNVLFRIAAIVPIAIRLFHSYITKATNTLEKANNNPIYRLCNTAAPYLLLAELSSCALFSIITIRFDFPEFHRTAMFAFVISGTLHMLAHTATSLWKVTNDQKAIDQLSSAVKVVSFIGFGFAAPQFLNFQQKFIDFPNCHSYVPPFHAICEYLMFICNGGFHLTTLIDNRHASGFILRVKNCILNALDGLEIKSQSILSSKIEVGMLSAYRIWRM
ncbi:Uncharacterized protein C14B9.3 [Toxocara canis]|uniref:Uncharacterized protein C14B9.3 n=1 Tax=Toxocara canis TaxID=6265 RepID=A0A0B2W644_TOXCA|nr:Uncharacterized protein C14B9.3 [Toxocara canis]